MTIDNSIFSAPAESTGRKTDYSDDDTYGIRLLKFLNNNKKIVKFLAENNCLETNGQSLYSFVYVSISLALKGNKSRISYPVMFRCREFIRPAYWFYGIKEQLPEQMKQKYNYKNFTEELFCKPTLGHIEFEKYIQENGQIKTAEKFNVKVDLIKNLLRKRKRPDGVVSYHSLPSLMSINAFKDIISPEKWFIYPEEIE